MRSTSPACSPVGGGPAFEDAGAAVAGWLADDTGVGSVAARISPPDDICADGGSGRLSTGVVGRAAAASSPAGATAADGVGCGGDAGSARMGDCGFSCSSGGGGA